MNEQEEISAETGTTGEHREAAVTGVPSFSPTVCSSAVPGSGKAHLPVLQPSVSLGDSLRLVRLLESAAVGSLDLDVEVCDALKRGEADGLWVYLEDVTTSIDAALALAKRVLSRETYWELSHRSVIGGHQMFYAVLCPPRPSVEPTDFYGYAYSPALAICAALLRASAKG